jgi:hypothetical protein
MLLSDDEFKNRGHNADTSSGSGDWVEYYDDEYGAKYWYNEVTGESTYEDPSNHTGGGGAYHGTAIEDGEGGGYLELENGSSEQWSNNSSNAMVPSHNANESTAMIGANDNYNYHNSSSSGGGGGGKWCSECGEAFAARACNECQRIYCVDCHMETHKNNHAFRGHTFNNITT